MKPIKWLSPAIMIAIHSDLISEHGGSPGVRDAGLLESALTRPKNLHAYSTPSICELAAAYGYGLARTHVFVDGNKRSALMAIYVFLGLNGYTLEAPEDEAVKMILGISSDETDEATLSCWIKDNTTILG